MTQKELKYYSSLLKKKFRNSEKKFIAEGKRIVEEGLKSNYSCEKVFISDDFHKNENVEDFLSGKDYVVLKKSEFEKLTDTVNSQGILSVFNIPSQNKTEEINSRLIVYIDNISDPGNLGAILRTCDWFGINTILLSKDTVDVYNPKVVRSTMGSIFHLSLFEEIGINALQKFKDKGYKIVCSDLKGDSLYNFKVQEKIILTFSSEAAGVSKDILGIADYKITIPGKGKAESLNVAAASAVILSEILKPVSLQKPE